VRFCAKLDLSLFCELEFVRINHILYVLVLLIHKVSGQ
jgi:hypothetical protein